MVEADVFFEILLEEGQMSKFRIKYILIFCHRHAVGRRRRSPHDFLFPGVTVRS